MVFPDDSFRDVEEKALDWLAAGTVAVVLLDPDRRPAMVYRGQGEAHVDAAGETLDLSDAVPGWSVAVEEFFA